MKRLQLIELLEEKSSNDVCDVTVCLLGDIEVSIKDVLNVGGRIVLDVRPNKKEENEGVRATEKAKHWDDLDR